MAEIHSLRPGVYDSNNLADVIHFGMLKNNA